MQDIYNQKFESLSTVEKLGIGIYEACQFKHCNFQEQAINNYQFINCSFRHCNLSLVACHQTSFRGLYFEDCKMTGIHFEHCKPFLLALRFENCQLDLSSFYGLELSGTDFGRSSMKEVDFANANLSQANLRDCNLSGALFENTELEAADFSHALNYRINPTINHMKNACFTRDGLEGLLQELHIKIEG